jgi:ribosome-associated protein
MNDLEKDTPEERQTKSERKRQMLALQELGEILVSLPEVQLKKIPMDSRLLDAVNAARALTSHEAIRRQLQYIGKLMRNIDPAPIQVALEKIQGMHQQNKAQFHQIERWRDKLIVEGDSALTKLLEQYPDVDSQQIRQLIRKAQHDVKNNKKTGGETELFRYLRQFIETP